MSPARPERRSTTGSLGARRLRRTILRLAEKEHSRMMLPGTISPGERGPSRRGGADEA
jgi:hypothetical protein